MKLPQGVDAIIDLRKWLNYALSFDHDDGKHKAALFRELLGITVETADRLIEGLHEAAAHRDTTLGRRDRYGQRYQIDFDFSGPVGRAVVRSVWIVAEGEAVPRLVTCYIL